MAGYIVELSKDQYGSRFLQQRIDSSTSSSMTMIFEELKPHLAELMVDVFGNYVVQKALRRGSSKHVNSIVSAMESNILELSLSTYGCRVGQTALDVIPDSDKRRLASELKAHVKRCVRSLILERQDSNDKTRTTTTTLKHDNRYAIKTVIMWFRKLWRT